MVEQLGSGMNRILKDYNRSIFTIGDGYIRVTFKYVMGIDEKSLTSLQTNNQSGNHTAVRYLDHTSVRTKNSNARAKTISKEAVKANMVTLIRNNPRISITELSTSEVIARSTAIKYLNELVDSGLIRRVGNNKSGYWKIL